MRRRRRRILEKPTRYFFISTHVHEDTSWNRDLAVVVIEETCHERCFILFAAHLEEGAVEGCLGGWDREVEAEDG
jgi:hypothetical protein